MSIAVPVWCGIKQTDRQTVIIVRFSSPYFSLHFTFPAFCRRTDLYLRDSLEGHEPGSEKRKIANAQIGLPESFTCFVPLNESPFPWAEKRLNVHTWKINDGLE